VDSVDDRREIQHGQESRWRQDDEQEGKNEWIVGRRQQDGQQQTVMGRWECDGGGVKTLKGRKWVADIPE
jgi:hypothetical protein